MLLGYNTNGFAHHRLADALRILADLGYQSVAITLDKDALDPFDDLVSCECDFIGSLLDKLGLRCVIETGARFLLDPQRKHQPTLLSEETSERARRFDFIRRSIEIAHLLRADAVSFWSGTPQHGATEQVLWQRLIDNGRLLSEEAARQNVRLAFEPEPGMFIDTMPKFAELHRRVGHAHFGLTLDVGHLHCMGETPIAEHIHRWKDWLWNVHIEDMRRGVHEHLMFGDGEMEFPPIMQALHDVGYAGGVHVELSRHSHDAVNTARQAIDFLRNVNGQV